MTQYVVPMYESERGWGSKIDGYAGPFGDIGTANKFRSYYNKANNSEAATPDWYIAALEPVEHKGQKCEYISTMPDQEQAMITPTQTEYGPEIVVDGVRLPWLKDDEEIQIRAVDGYEDWDKVARYKPDWWGFDAGQDRIAAIRLRATHPYYQVQSHNAKHGTQFKYWPGGDEAPGDYDGGEVLLENPVGTMLLVYNPAQWTPNEVPHLRRVIGYTPKPCATSIHSADVTVDVVKRLREDIDHADKMDRMMKAHEAQKPCADIVPTCSVCSKHKLSLLQLTDSMGELTEIICEECMKERSRQEKPDFVPCERTLRMAIEKVGAINSHGVSSAAKHALETLLPKKDPIAALVDRWIVEDTVVPTTDKERLAVEHALQWLVSEGRLTIAQGEIRG